MISCTQGCQVQWRGWAAEGGTGNPPGIALVPVLSLGTPRVNLSCSDQHWMLVMAKVIRLRFTYAASLLTAFFCSLYLFVYNFYGIKKGLQP